MCLMSIACCFRKKITAAVSCSVLTELSEITVICVIVSMIHEQYIEKLKC